MKTKKLFRSAIMLLLAFSMFTISCKSDDDGGDGGGVGEGTITAKVEGASFTSIPMTTTASKTEAGGTSIVTIQGTGQSQNAIILMLSGVSGIGSYPIGGGANIANNASYMEVDVNNPANTQTWTAPYDTSVSGEVKISEMTGTHIKGSFHFKGKNDSGSFKNITDGQFNVKFMQP